MPPKVYNKRRPHPPDAVLVDRSTDFGNPFKIGPDGDRETVIDKYEYWIFQPQQKQLRVRMLNELRGKDLLCWCAPEECHADVILGIANARQGQWYVIAVDWKQPNVLSQWDNEEAAKDAAERMDGLALRAIAVPEGHPLIRE